MRYKYSALANVKQSIVYYKICITLFIIYIYLFNYIYFGHRNSTLIYANVYSTLIASSRYEITLIDEINIQKVIKINPLHIRVKKRKTYFQTLFSSINKDVEKSNDLAPVSRISLISFDTANCNYRFA